MSAGNTSITKVDLKGVHKDLQETVLTAVNVHGWTWKKGGSGGISLSCPCGEHYAYAPLGSKTSHVIKGFEGNIKRCPANKGISLDLPKRARKEEVHLTAPVAAIINNGEPILVSEKTHMSKKGDKDGKTLAYPSPVTIEQTWSDGHVSFRCKHCGWGGYDQENPRAVANHSGNMHKDPENKKSQREVVVLDMVIPPLYTKGPSAHKEYTPTERLVNALAEYLEQAGTMDPLALSYAALQWLHERPDLGDLDRGPSEPLTAEDQIRKIRSIVDGGRYSDLENEIEKLRAALQDAEKDRDEAITKAEATQKRLEKVAEDLMEGL